MNSFDFIIKNAVIVDGSGGDIYKSNIFIKDSHIVKICSEINDSDEAKRIIDAKNKYVIPGFVDVHTHNDTSVFDKNINTKRLLQGITTDICGNCGSSSSPVVKEKRSIIRDDNIDIDWESQNEYYNAVEKSSPPYNFASIVGHGTLRKIAVGLIDKEPSKKEYEIMENILDESLKAGAVGMSSGLTYIPGAYAKTNELIRLCKTVAKNKKLYTTHMRSESMFVVEAVKEVIEIAKKSRVSAHISHHKTASPAMYGKSKITTDLISSAIKDGVDITLDVYPYTACCTSLSALLPHSANEGGVEKMLERIKIREEKLSIIQTIISGTPTWQSMAKTSDWKDIIVVYCGKKQYEGKSIHKISTMMLMNEYEAMFKILEISKGEAMIIVFEMNEDDVIEIMKKPYAMIASDSVISDGRNHPRCLGTFARVLSYFVKEKKVLSLEEAIHKTTYKPAKRFLLKDRGIIKENAFADLIILDFDNFKDNTTYEEPDKLASGIEAVFVNGKLAVEKGKVLVSDAGSVIRVI